MDQLFSKLVDSDWQRDVIKDEYETETLTDDTSSPHLDTDPVIPIIPPKKKDVGKPNPNLLTSMVAGAAAGVVVDFSLYPLDTVKTRLQSKRGLKASGGFRGVYKGIVPVIIGSAPISALFFATYNETVNKLKSEDTTWDPIKHVVAASVAEVVAATVRVPLEIVKQRKQTSSRSVTSWDIVRRMWHNEGFLGMYRGFLSTITREVPFAAIQFPVWEFLKKQVSKEDEDPTSFQTAYCGAIAGGLAAALTTPMDVVKTRVMLADKDTMDRYTKLRAYRIGLDIMQEKGLKGLFAGVVPRVLWITLGGFIYFGVYGQIKATCEVRQLTLSQHEVYMQEISSFRKRELEQRKEAQTAPTYKETTVKAKKKFFRREVTFAPTYGDVEENFAIDDEVKE